MWALGRCFELLDRPEDSLPHFEEALAIARVIGEPPVVRERRSDLADCLERIGEFDRALRLREHEFEPPSTDA
jgi:hypothetical protein